MTILIFNILICHREERSDVAIFGLFIVPYLQEITTPLLRLVMTILLFNILICHREERSDVAIFGLFIVP